MNVNIMTNHIVERTMERTNLNREKAERMILLAMERGKAFDEAEGKIKKYLFERQIGTRVAKEYNGYCYIIEETEESRTGITMFAIPRGATGKEHYDGKTRIRNVKKYARFHA